MDDLPLPANIEAERAVLGSILLDRDAIIAVPWLSPSAFYAAPHRLVFEAMRDCERQRIPPDMLTVMEAMRRRNTLDRVGGVAFLTELSNAVPWAVHIEHYARVVERAARRRQLIAATAELARLAHDETTDDDTFERTAQGVFAAALTRSNDGGYVHISTIVERMHDQIAAGGTQGIPTGFIDLDKLTGGLQPKEFWILAARPSVGKSALGFQIAYNVASAGHAVGIVSLEMPDIAIGRRLAAMLSNIDTRQLRDARLNDDEWEALIQAEAILSRPPLYIDETPAQTAEAIQRKALKLAAEHGPLGLVVVDYLQLGVAPGTRGDTERVGAVSRALAALPKMLNCTVLALAQLNREVERRNNHMPVLSDLRDSGQIEQDANVIAFLHREELYDKETDKKGVAEVMIAKARDGATGVVPLRYIGQTTSFQSLHRYNGVEGY